MGKINDKTHGEKSEDDKAPKKTPAEKPQIPKGTPELVRKSEMLNADSLSRVLGTSKMSKMFNDLDKAMAGLGVKKAMLTREPSVLSKKLSDLDKAIAEIGVQNSMFTRERSEMSKIFSNLEEARAKKDQLRNTSAQAQVQSAEELKKLNETLARVEKNTSTKRQFKTAFFSAVCGGVLVALLVAVFSEIIRRVFDG